MFLSIVFPIFNEYENLTALLQNWDQKLRLIENLNYEFVLVEDGSNDGTKELIKDLEKIYKIKNLSQITKRGYTKAVLDGINNSDGDYILCTDSDNQIKVESLINNLQNFPLDDQFLIGYRNPRNDPFNRIIYSKLFKLLHDVLFNSKLKDPSCPFVIGKKNTYKKLPTNLLNQMKEGFWWGFVAVCIKKNIKIYETPITHYKRISGEAGYKIIQLPFIILRNIKGLLKIKFSK